MIKVSVGLILRDDEVLVSRRRDDQSFANMLEFPGGKQEAGENAALALRRELKEELGIDAGAITPFALIPSCYDEGDFLLSIFLVHSFSGELAALEGQQCFWCQRGQLPVEQFLSGNDLLVRLIKSLQNL